MSVTLAEIERELARRTGPFEQFTVSGTTASTQTLIYVDDLKTSVEQGGLDGLWFLWRTPNSTDDRQRMVKGWDADEGYLELDRALGQIPSGGTAIELMALRPAPSVRKAVQRGLARCYLDDRVSVVLGSAAADRDLTAALPWLRRKKQLLEAFYAPAATAYPADALGWHDPYERAGRVWLAAGPDPFPSNLVLRVLRPADSRINGLSSPACPVVSDVTSGGALPANTLFYVAVAVDTVYGTTPACPPVRVYTTDDGSGTHVLRVQIPKNDDGRLYRVYASAEAAPKRVANVTEAQRAAGCTVTAVDTVSATSPGAGYVDIRVAGTSSVAVQASSPSDDDDLLDVDLDYAVTAAHQYLWETSPELLAPLVSGGRMSKDDVLAAWASWVGGLPAPKRRIQHAAPLAGSRPVFR